MWDLFQQYGPRLLLGLTVTLKLMFSATALGGLLAWPLALGMTNEKKWISRPIYFYAYIMRGTPLLAQTYLFYFGMGDFRPQLQSLGLWWIFKDAYYCVLITFTLNTAAYQAEVLRGAINAINPGQLEAAKALGVGPIRIWLSIVMPQALQIALRPLSNEVILMLKGSAIASVVTVEELMGATRIAFAQTFDFRIYVISAVFYVAVIEITRNVLVLFEKRLTRHLPKAATAAGKSNDTKYA